MNIEKYYLGKLCKKNHDHCNSGKSLRLISDWSCYECRKDSSKNRKNYKKRTNIASNYNYLPSKQDQEKYAEANYQEIWKPIIGEIKNINFDVMRNNGKNYEISNFGRIRYWKNKNLDWFYVNGCISTGYKRTNIRYDGKLKTIFVHVLMAYVFFGPPKDKFEIVRHLDDNGLGNYVSNLCWGSYADNRMDLFKNKKSCIKPFDEKITIDLSENEINCEIWKPLYETKLYISNMGRIKNKNGFLIKFKKQKAGYLYCSIGKTRNMVHKMVADHFIGEKFDKKLLIRHLDDNKLNNKVSNLCYGTTLDNASDRKLNNKYNPPTGEKHANSKLSELEVIDIKKRLLKGETTYKLSKEYNVARTNIDAIKHGKTWKNIG
jgi:hypothetical protein